MYFFKNSKRPTCYNNKKGKRNISANFKSFLSIHVGKQESAQYKLWPKKNPKENIAVWWWKVIRTILGFWPIAIKNKWRECQTQSGGKQIEFRQGVKGITEFHLPN